MVSHSSQGPRSALSSSISGFRRLTQCSVLAAAAGLPAASVMPVPWMGDATPVPGSEPVISTIGQSTIIASLNEKLNCESYLAINTLICYTLWLAFIYFHGSQYVSRNHMQMNKYFQVHH